MKKYALYLFDFDGTILDTMAALEFVFSVSYEHVGTKFDPKDTVEFSRIPLDVGYKRLNANPEKWWDFAKYIEKSLDFKEALERNHPYPETYEFIDYLRKNKIRAGIVTSNKIKHVKEVLEVMHIPEDTFEVYVGNKEYKFFKPHADPVLQALKRAKYDGPLEKVVYVGDGYNDALCANNAGVDAIIVDRINAFEKSDKYTIITNLMELFK